MFQDLRHALRLLVKNPLFALVGIVTLALGIGATTAVFTLVNALLIKPLPYEDPARLVLLFEHFKDQHLDTIPVSPPEFLEYKSQLKSFDKLARLRHRDLQPLRRRAAGTRLRGEGFSRSFPIVRRAADSRPHFPAGRKRAVGRDDVIVISERLWRRKFDRDPRVLGSKLMADGRAFTVVGIMPASFEFPLPLFNITGAQFGEQADIWQPLGFTDAGNEAARLAQLWRDRSPRARRFSQQAQAETRDCR